MPRSVKLCCLRHNEDYLLSLTPEHPHLFFQLPSVQFITPLEFRAVEKMASSRKRGKDFSSFTEKMASSRKRGTDFSSFTPKGPRFIMEIKDGITENMKPMIPREFLTKIENVLCTSNSVSLEDPNGKLWEVELLKEDDGITRFQNGWEDFADFYSLENKDLLVFEYKGGSKFSVFIYKEMNYPVGGIDSGTNQDGYFEEDSVDGNLVEYLAKFTSVPKQEKDVSCSVSSPDSPSQVILNSGGTKRKQRSSARNSKVGVADANDEAFERSCAFKPENPFFRIRMKKTQVSSNFHLSIPESFSQKVLMKREGKAILSFGRKIWPVSLKPKMDNGLKLFVMGWSRFAQDNGIKIGDVCIFELANLAKLRFEVSITRDS